MRIMEEEKGYQGLRVSFEPYMSTIGAGSTTLSELARDLGITKQAASQTLAELERMGYVSRVTCSEDGRSKQLQITTRGITMLDDGLLAYQAVETELRRFTSKSDINAMYDVLGAICLRFDLGPPIRETTHPGISTLGVLLSRASDFVQQRLMQLAFLKGRTDLKLSYTHVLSLLRPGGTRIQDIVRIRNLSKQAVGAIANELSAAEYLERRPDPEAPRQQRLHLTDKGIALIADSVDCVDELEQELSDGIGSTELQRLETFLSNVYRGLKLDQIEFGDLFDPELESRAKELIETLGAERARSLGRLLLS